MNIILRAFLRAMCRNGVTGVRPRSCEPHALPPAAPVVIFRHKLYPPTCLLQLVPSNLTCDHQLVLWGDGAIGQKALNKNTKNVS